MNKDGKMEKIRVFLSDPQVLFREGIHFTLSGEEDFEVTGETTNNEDALAAVEANPPTVAILNMSDGKFDGPEVTRRIKRNLPSTSIVLVMDKEDEEQLFTALKSGASACISKDTDPDHLVSLTRDIAQGNKPITEALLMPKLASKALVEFEALTALSEQLNKLLAHLSPKEAELLNLIAAGSSLPQVAAKLGSGEQTIRHELSLIANKLVGNDQARAVIFATQQSLPLAMPGMVPDGKPAREYITRDEFIEFKDSLMQRLKTFIGELA